MKSRKLADGTVMRWGRPKGQDHNVFYLDAGPDGMMLLGDFNNINQIHLHAMLSINDEGEDEDFDQKIPRAEFNMKGWAQ